MRNRRLQRKKRGGVGDKSRREKEQRRDGNAGTRMRTGRGGAEVFGAAESERRKNSTGRQGPRQRGAVPAEIVQDAAGNLHPFGLHDEDPQQEQRIPAPRGRGPTALQEDSGSPENTQRRRRRRLPRKREGRGAEPLTSFRLPRPGTPRLGRGGGRSPESHAPALLERPNGKVENWDLRKLSQWEGGELSKLSQ